MCHGFKQDVLRFPIDMRKDVPVSDARYPKAFNKNNLILAGIIVLFFFCLSMISSGSEAQAQIIPADRLIKWQPGIPGSIPQRTTICANVRQSPYNAKGDGITDDTEAIRRAISSCPNGQVVHIPEGTYRLSSELQISGKSIVLRGDGQRRTFLKNYSNSGNILSMYTGSGSYSPIKILSGYAKDSTAITIEDASSIRIGDYVVVYQDNDIDVPVDPIGCGGNCNWCGLYDNSNHAMTQIVRITAKNGNTLSLNRPLYYTFKSSLNPELLKLSMMEKAGVEDLSMVMMQAGSGARNGIGIARCAHCWVKNVEIYKIRNHHISIMYSYGIEVRQNYLHHGWGTYPGDWAYGVMLYFANSDNLIEDNIFYVLRHSMILEGGGSGNVFAYNYSKDSQGNVGDHWMFADMVTHGAHPYMNLFEGNIAVQLDFDSYWGSSSHNTVFRNWVERRSNPPEDKITDALYAVVLGAKNHFHNVVGNVLCHEGCSGVYQAPTFVKAEIWHLGYLCPSSSSPTDATVESTLLRHGNYDYITNFTIWDSLIPERNLPPSYYLASKPSFFGGLSWPAIGPDLTPMVGQIPAKMRFESMAKLEFPIEFLPPAPPSGGGEGGGCLIARAVYGSDSAPQVKVLHKFRDRYLLHHPTGQALLNLYYRYSPFLSDFVARHQSMKAILRWCLLPIVGLCYLALRIGIMEITLLVVAVIAGIVILSLYTRKRILIWKRHNWSG